MRRTLSASEVILLHNTFRQDRYIRQRATRYMRRKRAGWGNRGFRRYINQAFSGACLSQFTDRFVSIWNAEREAREAFGEFYVV